MKTSLKIWVSEQLWTRGIVVASVLLVLLAGPLSAQVVGGTLRPYWHIFIAYAVAWLVVVGWLIHIARRLGRVAHDGS